MGPVSSGPDTLMDLATRCAGNSVRPAAPTWLVIACGLPRGLVVEQPRQETAATISVGIGLSLMMFMTSLPSCFRSYRDHLSCFERAGHARRSRSRPHTSITSLHDHSHGRRGGHVSCRIPSACGQRV